MHREPQPVKMFTIAPMFRYGAPQKGRFREHWQASVEAIGTDDPAIDAEVIQLYDTLLHRLGVTDYELELNSIGCRECRPAYVQKLRAWLEENSDRLDEATLEKARTSPLRALDNMSAKPPPVQEALAEAPTVGESLCEACREHFAAVRSYLDAYGVHYTLVPTLVRGLDYYTRTTWQFEGPWEGAQSTISGGGRYDGLIEEIGGPQTPGVGFGAGVERLLLAVEAAGGTAEPPSIDVFFALEEGAPRERVLSWMTRLRGLGVSSDADYAGRSLKGQLTQSARLGAATTVIVREADALVRRQGVEDEAIRHESVLGRLSP
jgi:histidyl-tRNA synthetase